MDDKYYKYLKYKKKYINIIENNYDIISGGGYKKSSTRCNEIEPNSNYYVDKYTLINDCLNYDVIDQIIDEKNEQDDVYDMYGHNLEIDDSSFKDINGITNMYKSHNIKILNLDFKWYNNWKFRELTQYQGINDNTVEWYDHCHPTARAFIYFVLVPLVLQIIHIRKQNDKETTLIGIIGDSLIGEFLNIVLVLIFIIAIMNYIN